MECAKIRKEWNCGIPGLFSLPLSLVKEVYFSEKTAEKARDEFLVRQELEQQLRTELTELLGSDGCMETASFSCCEVDGCLVVTLRARCCENIAVERMRLQED